MNHDLEITKDIVAAMAPGFSGDGRAATIALRKISETIRKYDSADAKEIARAIMVGMGPDFKGNANQATNALDRILGSMVVRKKKRGGAAEISPSDIHVAD